MDGKKILIGGIAGGVLLFIAQFAFSSIGNFLVGIIGFPAVGMLYARIWGL